MSRFLAIARVSETSGDADIISREPLGATRGQGGDSTTRLPFAARRKGAGGGSRRYKEGVFPGSAEAEALEGLGGHGFRKEPLQTLYRLDRLDPAPNLLRHGAEPHLKQMKEHVLRALSPSLKHHLVRPTDFVQQRHGLGPPCLRGIEKR